MLQENIKTFKENLTEIYNILNSVDIQTNHYNAKKYSIAMDKLSDLYNSIETIFESTKTDNCADTTR